MTELKCPYKFGHYEFEGGQDCIGIECGMHKLCGANDTLAAENDVSAVSVDANDGNELHDSREKLEADMHDLFWGDNLQRYARQKGYLDGSGIEVNESITTTNHEGHVTATTVMHLLDRQAAITEHECFERSVFDLGAHKQIIEQGRTIVEYADKNAELRKQVDELTTELTAAHNAHAQAEHEAATLRDKLGRMLDCSHEITRIGGDC